MYYLDRNYPNERNQEPKAESKGYAGRIGRIDCQFSGGS
nr:MAG TPA: hypothetical protein [Caudoviricetes sp.]